MPAADLRRRTSSALVLIVAGVTATGASAVGEAETVTEIAESDYITIESTVAPERFSDLAPGEIIYWDIEVHLAEPGNIHGLLHIEGNMSVDASVYVCDHNWTAGPEAADLDTGCERPLELVEPHRVEPAGEDVEFGVPGGERLRLALEVHSFAPSDAAMIFFTATAAGETVQVEPSVETPQPTETTEHAPTTETASSTPQPTAPPGTTAPLAQTQQPETTHPDGERPTLAQTGVSALGIVVMAALMVGAGTYLKARSRKVRP